MNETIRFLIAAEKLPADYALIVARYWLPLASHIAQQRKPDLPLIVGINGAQGSGKSTSCLFLEALLGDMGLNAVTLSLSPLSDEETARLLATLLGRGLLPAQTQAAMIERAEFRLASSMSFKGWLKRR